MYQNRKMLLFSSPSKNSTKNSTKFIEGTKSVRKLIKCNKSTKNSTKSTTTIN